MIDFNQLSSMPEKDFIAYESQRAMVFTGARPQRLTQQEQAKARAWLGKIIEEAVKRGFDLFVCGGALGVDTWAAQHVLKQKEKAPEDIKLVLELPFPGFENRWKQADKDELERIKEQANLVIYTAEKFSRAAYQKRNLAMLDWINTGKLYEQDWLIGVWTGGSGGTKNCIDAAKEKGMNIYVFMPKTDRKIRLP